MNETYDAILFIYIVLIVNILEGENLIEGLEQLPDQRKGGRRRSNMVYWILDVGGMLYVQADKTL